VIPSRVKSRERAGRTPEWMKSGKRPLLLDRL